MVHGTKDYGNVYPKQTLHRLDDMAELAARLGSPDVFERLGDIVLIDSFENGLVRWGYSFTAPDGNVSLSGDYAKTGGFSVALLPASALGGAAYIKTYIAYPVLSRFGFEVSFAFYQDFDYIAIYGYVYDGSKVYHFGVRYNESSTELMYLDNTNTWVDIKTPYDLDASYWLWHTVKFVIDFSTKEYVRMVMDADVFSMAGYSLYSEVGVVSPYILLYIEVHGTAAGGSPAYVDDVIITQNEP